MKKHILIVEDEEHLAEALAHNLQFEGYSATVANDGEEGLRLAQTIHPDLIILDIMMPKLDGLEVCRRLRAGGTRTPILFLTAKSSDSDRLLGLKVGADDYVTKPFGTRELLARLEAVQRRVGAGRTEGRIEVDGLRVDLGRCEAARDGNSCTLTPREVGILNYLFQHRGRAASRGELLEKIWGSPGDLETRTVDMTISNLRQKIERDPSRPAVVVTVKGVGYAWGPR